MDDISLYGGKPQKYLGLTFRNPLLKDVLEFEGGYDEYLQLISFLTSGVKDVADVLWIEGKIWYEDYLSDWMFFLQREISQERYVKIKKGEQEEDGIIIGEKTAKILNFFLGLSGDYVIAVEGNPNEEKNMQLYLTNCRQIRDHNIYIVEEDSVKFLEPHYTMLVNYLKKIHWMIDDYDFLRGGNRFAKKYLLKLKYRKRNKKRKEETTFLSMLSSIIAKGVSYKEIWEMPIYTILDIFYRINKITDYDNTVSALYTGAIDTKKNPVNWEKINWASSITLEKLSKERIALEKNKTEEKI